MLAVSVNFSAQRTNMNGYDCCLVSLYLFLTGNKAAYYYLKYN